MLGLLIALNPISLLNKYSTKTKKEVGKEGILNLWDWEIHMLRQIDGFLLKIKEKTDKIMKNQQFLYMFFVEFLLPFYRSWLR